MSGHSGCAGRCVPGHRGPDSTIHRVHHDDPSAQPGVSRCAAEYKAADTVCLWGHSPSHRRPF